MDVTNDSPLKPLGSSPDSFNPVTVDEGDLELLFLDSQTISLSTINEGTIPLVL
jgi:hypothetical protein